MEITATDSKLKAKFTSYHRRHSLAVLGMAVAMQEPPTPPTQPLAKANQVELDRIEEVLRLLDNLLQREEATAKSIVDCLYDVGSVRLIDQRIPLRILRWPLKSIAQLSKPIFRIFALRWLKKNCPWLITRWLFSQVRFDGEPLPFELDQSPVIDVAPEQMALPPSMDPLLEYQAAEINALRSRVSLLTTAVVVLIGLAGISMLR